MYRQAKPKAGLSIGANLAFGTHFQRLGFTLHFYVIQDHVQANTEFKLYYNFKNLGPPQSHPELVLSQGLLYAWQNNSEQISAFVNPVSNQTAYRYAVAYAYNAYFNKVKTTQQTGQLGLYFNQWSLVTENDLLARPALDRYRTASFLLQYRYQANWQIGIQCTLWTGQFGHKQTIDNPQFKNHCYMDSVGGPYVNQSHGLLSVQVNSKNYVDQNLQMNAGIDAEQVRNVIQNKFIHDMPFIPSKWVKNKNCHLPMLDTDGKLFLYQANQKVKKPKLFLNVFNNAALFY
ncbi:MAG: polymorphic toxin type 23 domain-containing protein [Bacteroidota bacterium]